MMANNTSIRHLFNRCLSQYDMLMKRKAFLDKYRVCSVAVARAPNRAVACKMTRPDQIRALVVPLHC